MISMKKIQTVTTKKGGEGGGEEDNPIQDDDDNEDTDSTVHKIRSTKGDDESTDDDDATIKTVDNKDKDESRGDNEPQTEPEDGVSLRSRAVRTLDCALNGKHEETVWLDLYPQIFLRYF